MTGLSNRIKKSSRQRPLVRQTPILYNNNAKTLKETTGYPWEACKRTIEHNDLELGYIVRENHKNGNQNMFFFSLFKKKKIRFTLVVNFLRFLK